ncbi:MAG: glutamate 5-kinase [Actinomycetota bacterium]|nr:glutamate 5-kinase [Actinomycetota bacterium]
MTRPVLETGDRLVVKVGTSSIVDASGHPDEARLAKLCDGIATARKAGIEVILVSSGAIAAGLQPLGLPSRPADIPSLQAAAAVGQGRLLQRYSALLAERDLVCAQMLLTQHDFVHRQQYLNARNTLDRLLALGAIPVVNENDTVATDEIRFGDNDRLAALVGNLARARLLALLTDARGLHSEDPRKNPSAPLLEEVDRITPELERSAGGRGSDVSTGGMASKIAAAWVATFSGVGVVVASADEASLERLIAGDNVGTYFHPHPTRASARRLWIAFAQPPKGTIVVDPGARKAMTDENRSLLAVGVVEVRGTFEAGATVDVMERDKEVFARGLVRYDANELSDARGKPTAELAGREVIHRDELVILEG